MCKRLCIALVMLLALVSPRPALAHRDDYLGETFVYQTLRADELALDYYVDAGRRSDRGQNFLRQNFGAEYGITEHWMADARVSGINRFGGGGSDGFDFDSARVETRYRFFEENTLPIDIAVSGEVNVERADDGSMRFGLEPRLILSKDLGRAFNLTLNLQEDFPLNDGGEASTSALGAQRIGDRPAFDPAFGMRYNFSEAVRVGTEVKYNFETHKGVVIPQVWFGLPREVTMKLGAFLPFDDNRQFFFRAALEFEF